MLSLNAPILIFLFLCSNIISKASVQPHCPMHCSICLPNYISCTSGGLLSIPFQLQPRTEKIILSNQLQFHGILTRENFTELAPPKFSIQNLSIRSSSIQELREKTFEELTHLKVLDLSENQRLTITYQAFYGLKLNILKMDEVGKLILLSGSFDNLSTKTLSMKNSRLQSLNYELFQPLLFTLKHLFIENNQIRTLDQRFEILINKLESINLKDNPFVCYCPSLWLKRTLISKIKGTKYKDGLYDAQSNDLERNIFPKCVAPSYLRNRQLQSISEAEFNCHVPRISLIEINLLSTQVGEMVCRIYLEEKGQKIPTKIFWEETQIIEEHFKRFRRKSASINNVDLAEPSEVNDLSAKIKINADDLSESKIFRCVAQNSAGHSAIGLKITWPSRHRLGKGLLIPFNVTEALSFPELSPDNGYFNNVASTSYLFTKQYTLLEMTVAIVGTFFITVLIFLSFYKVVFRRKNCYKSGNLSYKYSVKGGSPNFKKRSVVAIHSQTGGYTIYEPPVQYSDSSQTYESIPRNSIQPHDNLQQQQLLSSFSNSPSAHFIDYKTHKNLS